MFHNLLIRKGFEQAYKSDISDWNRKEAFMHAYEVMVIKHLLTKCKAEGIVVEAGCYKGELTRFLAQKFPDKTFYAIDTFTGLIDAEEHDYRFEGEPLANDQYKAGYEYVKAKLERYSNIKVIRKDIKECELPQTCFSLIDTDTHKSVMNGLKAIYPKTSKGGIILIHDYTTLNGATEAVNKFFEDKPEPVIKIGRKFALILKT